jgi:hypothetical protein
MARTRTRSNGISLAKGPVAIVGIVGILYGLGGLIFASHGFSLAHVPHGAVQGKHWIGLVVNGWSELLFIGGGLVLLLFAPLHWGAKTMAFLVGLILIAGAIIAVIRGDGVFGIFAANKLTELVWAAAGVLLLVLSFMPRVGARRGTVAATGRGGATTGRAPAAAPTRSSVPAPAVAATPPTALPADRVAPATSPETATTGTPATATTTAPATAPATATTTAPATAPTTAPTSTTTSAPTTTPTREAAPTSETPAAEDPPQAA